MFEELISLGPRRVASMIIMKIKANKSTYVMSIDNEGFEAKNAVLPKLIYLRNRMHCKLSLSCLLISWLYDVRAT